MSSGRDPAAGAPTVAVEVFAISTRVSPAVVGGRPSIRHVAPSQLTDSVPEKVNGSGRGAPRRSAARNAVMKASASAAIAARKGRPAASRTMRPADGPVGSTRAARSSQVTSDGSTSHHRERVPERGVGRQVGRPREHLERDARPAAA